MTLRRGFTTERPHLSVYGMLGAVGACLAACGDPGTDTASGEDIRRQQQHVSPPTASFSASAARQWMVNFANSVKGDRISPPVGARAYSYAAIAVYESVVHGMPGYHSLAGQLNGLDSLPTPDPGLEYDWPTVLAQTMHQFSVATYVFPLRLFFEYTTPTQASLQALGPAQIGFRRAAGVSPEVIDNSIAFGNELSAALIQWANSDGYAQARFKGYEPPRCPSCWVPTGFSDTDKVALPNEPAFGTLRTLVLTSPDECAPPAPPPFSTDPNSAMFKEAFAVYDTERNLTDLQIEIARFWADGPGDTPTPSGHWLALATKFVRAGNLADAAAGYAFTSLGYYDSFIAVWESKYRFNLLRPETYIRRHIDPGWRPTLPTPQFPEYVSGHSGQSGAAGQLFDEWFGAKPFTDDTKLRRGFPGRSFANFSAAADEAAVSRLYGGIHYPTGNNNGLELGRCIGDKIIARVHMKD